MNPASGAVDTAAACLFLSVAASVLLLAYALYEVAVWWSEGDPEQSSCKCWLADTDVSEPTVEGCTHQAPHASQCTQDEDAEIASLEEGCFGATSTLGGLVSAVEGTLFPAQASVHAERSATKVSPKPAPLRDTSLAPVS